ncbi:PEPxxWA-CTERM sorting domain-containing protein [Phenylobacterium sp.]|uniref:PEPxxWA-CTERM sorting domain-containing protein n=1 Tax=Phenylobacterium sp. TaxID=1871053 RepID=UPI0025DD3174|nr:PEPxxWA-CTERM sorting domain-containing protein [Phenylobacterium sp.]
MKTDSSSRRTAASRRSLHTFAFAVASLGLLASVGAADAAIVYTGGTGLTVYGVAPYGGGGQPAPIFGANNVTGFNDVLLSPGHGFLTADPSIPHNILDTGIRPLALRSFQIGGGNGSGPFGAGQALITGPQIGFRLSDAAPAGGSASYMISSWDANFTVDGGGFLGNLGSYLSIGGRLSAPGSASAVSLVSNYYLNGIYQGQTAPLVLAAAGNGNFQALGGSGAVLRFGGGGRYRGLAIDNVAAALGAGTNLRVVSTLTAYADPASIDSFSVPLDLLDLTGTTLPDFAFSGSSGGVPEPAAWGLLLLGFGALGQALRGRRGRRGAVSPG